jgi:hypothetical protein
MVSRDVLNSHTSAERTRLSRRSSVLHSAGIAVHNDEATDPDNYSIDYFEGSLAQRQLAMAPA